MDSTMESWAGMLASEMEELKDPGPIIFCTLTDAEMQREFDSDFGCTSGKPFTAWTAERVYFPAYYDGYEWISSVPRNPCNVPTHHVGGG